MVFEFDTKLLFVRLAVTIEEGANPPSTNKCLALDAHFYLGIPDIELDRGHIQWVRAAYGLPTQKSIAQQIDEDFDPLPF